MARPHTEHLTATQERILACIRRSIVDRGEALTLEEIGDHVGLHRRGIRLP